jgi:hypothetical protein
MIQSGNPSQRLIHGYDGIIMKLHIFCTMKKKDGFIAQNICTANVEGFIVASNHDFWFHLRNNIQVQWLTVKVGIAIVSGIRNQDSSSELKISLKIVFAISNS